MKLTCAAAAAAAALDMCLCCASRLADDRLPGKGRGFGGYGRGRAAGMCGVNLCVLLVYSFNGICNVSAVA